MKTTQYDLEGELAKPSRLVRLTINTITAWTIYTCPFCLHNDQIREYRKAKLRKGFVQCPECQQTMTLKALTADFTPEQLATFLYSYVTEHNGYLKISWDKLKIRLRNRGIATQFWNQWYLLKQITRIGKE